MDFGLGPPVVVPNEIRKILVISLGTHFELRLVSGWQVSKFFEKFYIENLKYGSFSNNLAYI